MQHKHAIRLGSLGQLELPHGVGFRRGTVRLRVERHVRHDSHPVTRCVGDDLGACDRGSVRVDNRRLDCGDRDFLRQAFMQQELLVEPAFAVAPGDLPRLGLALAAQRRVQRVPVPG